MEEQLKKVILLQAAEKYGFGPAEATEIPGHRGGRNLVFSVGSHSVLRVSRLTDREEKDYAAETEFVHDLARRGAGVADVFPSLNGRLTEKAEAGGCQYMLSLFERAEGDQLAAHGYRYIEGRPLTELWFNTGALLGRIHALAESYRPENPRFDFFDKYNEAYLDKLIPDGLLCPFLGEEPVGKKVKQKAGTLLRKLRSLPKDPSHYGMIHFDFSDGNYNIDYKTGRITAFDFDNCRTGWYLFDLANLWAHGVGWAAWNPDTEERRRFMDRYFSAVCAGYRSERALSDETLRDLPLMVDAVRLENIIDEFEVTLWESGQIECDGEQAWRLMGLVKDEPFMGFFSEGYDPENPFDLDREE